MKKELILIFYALLMSQAAFAQELTKKQCAAIIKEGAPKAAVDYCLRGPSLTASDSGSSTSTEVDEFSIIKSKEGELFSVRKLDENTDFTGTVKTDSLKAIDLSETNKVDVQKIDGRITERPSPKR